MNPDNFQRVEIQNEADLWDWLEKNHKQSESIWLVTWKASNRDLYVSRDQVLDALIAFGWIDGRRLKLDEHKTMQLISPRKQQIWAKTYKDRAEKLRTEGKMQPAGIQAIEQSKADGKWDTLNHVDALEVPPALSQAIESANASDWWDKIAPSYKRNVLRWLASAKKSETKQKRIDTIVEHAAKGQKVPNY